jgi:hypothetical protein
MDVKNITTRDIFVGIKDRRLQSVEGLRQGVRFPAGETIEVPDAIRLSEDFDNLVTSSKLLIVAFGDSVTSTVQQEELALAGTGVSGLVEHRVTPTLGQTLFLLPSLYKTGGFARAMVNTLWYDAPDFFTITGGVFVWKDVGFTLDTLDDLLIWYELDV